MQNILNPEEIPVETLQERVMNYYNYIYPKRGSSTNVFITAVISKDVINQILSSNNGSPDGIRIYLSKDTLSESQDDIRLLAIPANNPQDQQYIDLLGDQDKVHFTDCRDPYCPNSFVPQQPNLLPPSYFA